MNVTTVYKGDIGSYTFSNNGNKIIIVNYKGEIILMDLESVKIEKQFKIGGGSISPDLTAVATDKNLKWLATGDNTLYFYDLTIDKLSAKYKSTGIRLLCFAGDTCIMCDTSGIIHILTSSGELVQKFSPKEKTGQFFGSIVKLFSWGEDFITISLKHGKYNLTKWSTVDLKHDYLIESQDAIITFPNSKKATSFKYPNEITTHDFELKAKLKFEFPTQNEYPMENILYSSCGKYFLVSEGVPVEKSTHFSIYNSLKGDLIFSNTTTIEGRPIFLSENLDYILSMNSGLKPLIEKIDLKI